MTYHVFIDGQEGTTGLKILSRLARRTDITVLEIDDTLRKDEKERARLINESDFTFLCLPDDAARTAVSLVENNRVKLIDASTAHRTNPSWVYGLPELSTTQHHNIATSTRVAVPGCYASGLLALTYPLIEAGVMPADYPLTCNATSGYSGGGKKMIEQYCQEDANRSPVNFSLASPRQYSLNGAHKHLPEMQYIAGLNYPPIFQPTVASYYSGMVVSIPLHTRLMGENITAKSIWETMNAHYKDKEIIKVMPFKGETIITDGFLSANALTNSDSMQIFVFGSDESATLVARFDNLGKGASGAAIQCMNIMMGIDETTGLTII